MTHATLERYPLSFEKWQTFREPWPRLLGHIALGCLMTVAFAPAALAVQGVLGVRSAYILFLIPVIVAATRLGLLAALAAAFSGTAASAYFFYPPIYSLRVLSPDDAVALAMFVSVAAITSHLSSAAQRHAGIAARNYRQLELLYTFSRKLAATEGPDEIVAAIREHASALVGREVTVITPEAGEGRSDPSGELARLPPPVRQAVSRLADGTEPRDGRLVSDPTSDRRWLLRPFSRSARAPGVLIVELDHAAVTDIDRLVTGVDMLLREAAATLDRLDLATRVTEAELRRRSEGLREAIIGSASHGLRTPLASILGSASVLASAPGVADDPRLSSLAQIIVTEAERLNGDIQKMLDAAALSSTRLMPDLSWIEPVDLLDAAVQARRRELAEHVLVLDCPHDLPLLKADAALASGALGLVLDNAARYSGPGTEIQVRARAFGGVVEIAISDEGTGLEPDELPHIFEKFYRGSNARASTRGTGLGLWIASAFVTACGGRIAAVARHDRAGTRVTIELPAATLDQMQELGGNDE